MIDGLLFCIVIAVLPVNSLNFLRSGNQNTENALPDEESFMPRDQSASLRRSSPNIKIGIDLCLFYFYFQNHTFKMENLLTNSLNLSVTTFGHKGELS